MQNKNELFFKDPRLPQAECRYSVRSERVFKPHLHSTLSIGCVEEGEVFYTVLDEKATLRPGALALINPEVMHSCNCAGELGRSYYMLYLEKNYCLKIQQSLWQLDTLQPMRIVLLEDENLYEKYLKSMRTLMDTNNHLMIKEQLLAELVTEVFQKSCQPAGSVDSEPKYLERIKKKLSKDLEMDTTLEKIAQEFTVNPYTLLRQFKAEYGITPHAYRMNCRIDKARRLLQEGQDIAETALDCGFFDQSHFHRNFKAHTTVTPREYQLNFIQ